MEIVARHLIFHASIVLFLGLLFGAPYARAIKNNAPAQIVNSWRVAHLSIPIGATLMLAIEAILSFLRVGDGLKWTVASLLITSSYAFCISTPLAVITGDRGLESGGKYLARLVYVGNMVGASTSLAAAAVLMFASFSSLRA